MAKTKTPFLSLGSQGTLGNTLTSQKRNSSTLLRRKPTPTDLKTLPQSYQRWLYEDYAYLWRQQSLATRQAYQSLGTRHHLTGFQYWMKFMLTNLPDIAAYWKLDQYSGAIAQDSSRNANHATIIGATPTNGLINGALGFDGINDWLNCGNDPSLNTPDALTIDLFFNHRAGQGNLATKGYSYWDAGHSWGLDFQTYANRLNFSLRNSANTAWKLITTAITLDTWYHLMAVWTGTHMLLYLNGILRTGPTAWTSIYTNTLIVALSRRSDAYYYGDNIIDQAIIYNRALDATDAQRHALRSYPL